MRHRARRDLLTDTLVWEREQGLHRSRDAGLSPAPEQELLDALTEAVPATETSDLR